MGRRLLLGVLLAAACAAPPPPQPMPEAPGPAAPAATRKVFVVARTLNVRAEPSTGATVLTQVKEGDPLTVLDEEKGWSKVRLANGTAGWVSSDYVSETKKKTKPGCESEFSFVNAPLASFSEGGPHGLVVIDATVSTKGDVTATKILSNSTGDDTLAKRAEREIRAAKFLPPYRNCVPRSFIFTYKRTF